MIRRDNRSLPIPSTVYNPGQKTATAVVKNPAEFYGEDKEFDYKQFPLPTVVGQELPILSTSNPHSAIDVMFDNRITITGGASTQNTTNFEYIVRVYGVMGPIRKQVAQGRFADTTTDTISGGTLCSVRQWAQRFDITIECVRPTTGQVALSYIAGDLVAQDPTFQSAPNGYVVNRVYRNANFSSGTFTTASAQLKQVYGFNNSGAKAFVYVSDSTGMVSQFLVPDQTNFAMVYEVPVFCLGGITWVAAATPGTGAAVLVGIFAQYR